MSLFLLWKVLKNDEIREIERTDTITKRGDLLCDAFHRDDKPFLSDDHRSAYVEMLQRNFSFCIKNGFSPEKTSTFMSLMNDTHETCCGDPMLTLKEGFKLFEDLLLKHSVDRPPFSICVFTFPEVNLITEYAISGYFRYLKLFQLIFGPPSGRSDLASKQQAEDSGDASVAESTEDQAEPEPNSGEAGAVEEAGDVQVSSLNEEERTEMNKSIEEQIEQLKDEFEEKMNAQKIEFAEKLTQLQKSTQEK
eukprot:948541_1